MSNDGKKDKSGGNIEKRDRINEGRDFNKSINREDRTIITPVNDTAPPPRRPRPSDGDKK